MQTTIRWIELDGAVNVRDLGGLPVQDGGRLAPRRLIRADNLQDLSDRDVRALIEEHQVRAVADLRSTVEVRSEGPGPLTREPSVLVLHASLFIEDELVEDGRVAGGLIEDRPIAATNSDAGPIVLPWQNLAREDRRSAAHTYQSFIVDRPDSIVAALGLIAHSKGATIVHCAAGKDRTGVVVAIALDAVGVPRAAIIDDYARTAERLPALLARLAASPTYTSDISLDDPQRHAPRPDTMNQFLSALDSEFGGSAGWLADHGWTDADQRALEAKLIAS
jgi:protein-tyrosine phosphatase